MNSQMGRSIAFNFLGLCLPLVVGILVMPGIISRLGISKFGVLSIIWVLIGYVSVFDLGIGRALTRAVSFKLGDKSGDTDTLVGVGLTLMLGLGIFSAVIVAVFGGSLAHFIQGGVASGPASAAQAMVAVAIAVPGVVLSNGVRGTLEAHGRFGWVSFSRASTGIATYALPYLISFYSTNLAIITLALAASRYVGVIILLFEMLKIHPLASIISAKVFRGWHYMRDLAIFGGWMTISNIVSPLMAYLDRIFVSNIVGVGNVGFYTAPADVVSRLSVFPDAIFGVFFPKMTASSRDGNSETRNLYILSLKLIQPVMLIFSAGVTLFGYVFLKIWLGPTFAENSYVIFCILTVVMYINSCTRPAYNVIQAGGRSDITAKIHIIEFFLYLPLIIVLARKYGLVGAAWASMLRVLVDYLAMTLFARKMMRHPQRPMEAFWVLLVGTALLAFVFLNPGVIRSAMLIMAIVLAVFYFWWQFVRGRNIVALVRR